MISENARVVRERYTPFILRLGYPSPLPIRNPTTRAATMVSQGDSPKFLESRAEV